jgi:hypothetical protein
VSKIIIAALILVAVPQLVFAASMANFESSKNEIQARVLFGDKKTEFAIKHVNGKAMVEMVGSDGDHRSTILTEKNFAYIAAELKKLPIAKKDLAVCYRSRMDIHYVLDGKSATKQSCLAINTATTAKYSKFANLLTLATE